MEFFCSLAIFPHLAIASAATRELAGVPDHRRDMRGGHWLDSLKLPSTEGRPSVTKGVLSRERPCIFLRAASHCEGVRHDLSFEDSSCRMVTVFGNDTSLP